MTNYTLFKKENDGRNSVITFQQFVNSVNKKTKTLVIDSILGSGVKGKLSEDFSAAITYLNKLKGKNKKLRIVSIDVPSGLMSGKQVNPVVDSDITITMGALKTELLYGEGKECAGDIFVIPIGVPDSYLNSYNTYNKYAVEYEDIAGLFPKRRKSSYKYSNGKALIIGGSAGLSGAVIMSSVSALKSGAGAVVAAIPESIASHFSRKLPDVIKELLEMTPEGSISGSSFKKISKRIDYADAVLIGPGISLNKETGSFVFEAIKKCSRNMVIDADALTVLAEDTNVLINREYNSDIILTPHIGEFSRLSGVSSEDILLDRFEVVRYFVSKYKVSVILKSETSFSCLGNREIYINTTGNESLGVVGSGDVLSGILVSLLAQTGDVYRTMICGNYIHGFCSDLYYEKYGNKQSASQQDFIKLIPKALTYFLN
jgi:NAD(P)H-hydrate epimerase